MFQIRKGYDTVSKTFRLPVDLSEKLSALAAQNKISFNQLVTQCLTYAVNSLVTEEKEYKDDEEKN